MYTPSTFSSVGLGSRRRRETGMVHSRASKVGGMAGKRAEAMRTGSVEVTIVVWALQACRK
jgi:hypothetical protein